ncbi:type II toxin-antitoxin system prevent-host-death family antitoxin [Escherichia coli]|uniref:type II toxin-antitoxin system prevent-host-death family antitoxin n=1 Tax=Escherichia coli TaxID=562 RepID=UPI001FD99C67|nr:type II toxin-antitoxin system prevent-host-death family antitoxin [Escherichia coli]
MQSINFRTARGNLSEVLNNVKPGKRLKSPAEAVSQQNCQQGYFRSYKKRRWMLNLHPCLTLWTPTNKELVNR